MELGVANHSKRIKKRKEHMPKKREYDQENTGPITHRKSKPGRKKNCEKSTRCGITDVQEGYH